MDSVEQVLKAFQTGQIGAAQFNTQMKALGYSLPQVVSLMNDINNPRVTEITIPTQANPPAQATGAAPAATTAAPTAAPAATVTPAPASVPRQQYADALPTPYYGMDGSETSIGYGRAQPQLTEDRAERARLGDLPSEFGSPAGSMAYPSQLAPSSVTSTVQQAIDVAKQRSAPQQTASSQTPQMDALHTLIRGRFGDAAKGNPMDDRLTAAQEARDKSGEARASGGEVNAKGGGKDAVLHKALEIIHHLITTR